jgi:hypothetical protein
MALDDDDEVFPPLAPLSEITDRPGPNGFPHGFWPLVDRDVGMTYEKYLKIRQWCADQYGREGDWPNNQWTENRDGIWFRRPEQAIEFKLRWM